MIESAMGGVVAPAIVAAIFLSVAAIRSGSASSLGRSLSAAGIAVAFAVGETIALGFPPMPPVEAQAWLPWIALAALLLSIWTSPRPVGDAAARPGRASRPDLRDAMVLIVAFLAAYAMLRPLVTHSWSVLGALAALGSIAAVTTLAWRGLCAAHDALPGWVYAGNLAALAGFLAPGLVFGGSVIFGQLAGIIASSAIVAFGVALIARRREGFLAGTVTPFAMLWVAVLASVYFVAELPLASGLLAAVGPAVGAPLGALLARRRPGFASWLLASALVLAPVIAATIVAYAAYDPSPSYY